MLKAMGKSAGLEGVLPKAGSQLPAGPVLFGKYFRNLL